MNTTTKIKRGRGHKIGPCKEWIDQRQRRIQQHRTRIVAEMKRIQKSGMNLHTTPVSDLLAAGVVLSNELYLTQSTLNLLELRDCEIKTGDSFDE